MSEVSVFYRVWDHNRVVLATYEHTSIAQQNDRVIGFRKYLEMKKKSHKHRSSNLIK